MPGLSGSDHARTDARLGILRLGAGRLNFPILAGVRVKKYALLNVARLGATRLGYHSPKVFVSVDGIPRAYQKADDAYKIRDLVIREVAGHNASRATFLAKAFAVENGMDVRITLGSLDNRRRLFAGTVLPTTQTFVGTTVEANREFSCSCIDYTWGLQKLKVTGRWFTTVAAIAAELIATYAQGYTVDVQAGFTDIDEFTVTDEDLPDVLTRLVRRGSPTGDWICDYDKVVHLFVGEDTSGTRPTEINAVYGDWRRLRDLAIVRDPSQWITRVYVEGGGANASTEVLAGETILPVEDANWYQASGGTVKSGPQGPRHITYTGRSLGGGGALVGPGASPSAAPVVALASGAGIESGAHSYGVTFVTAAGESIASPLAAITVGAVAAPSSAPTLGTPTIGTGPNPGSHDYAVTFVTSSGETTASPLATKATTLTPDPTTAPTPGTPTDGGSVDVGSHDYAVTFVTSIGETAPGPISGQVTTASSGGTALSPPSAPSGGGFNAGGSGPPYPFPTATGPYHWAVTFVNAGGETTPGGTTDCGVSGQLAGAGPYYATLTGIPTGPAGVTARKVYRTVSAGSQLKFVATIADNTTTTYEDHTDDTALGANAPTVNTATAPVQTVPLTAIPTGDANVTSRKLYRRSGGAGLKLLTTIANNTATTYTDTTANASLGAAAPVTSTAYLQRIPLTAIPLGGSLVTQRKLYRTVAGGAQLKLLTTLADNTTTTFTDTITDASLGANVPTSNTATANQVALSAIPIGAASVTQRKIYRTVAGGAQLKLQQTIADNTTTTGTDSTADASLGANVPTSDTSGLTQPSGQVPAGSTTLLVAGTGGFAASGGWAVIGNGQQVIRYTGITGSSLTGIPASGPGAITAAIGYNSNVTAAPQLTGIPPSGPGAIRFTILKGDPVNLRVQVDDLAGQAALSALLTTADVTHDGIKEATLQDRRLSFTEATALGEAHLAREGHLSIAATYTTGDMNTHAGQVAPFHLGAPTNLTADLPIKDVTISHFTPALPPDYAVTASTD